MSGRKQHFIQQLLLKGFSYDFPKKPCHVWVYQRGGKSFPTATQGYGAERDFYGAPTISILDAEITELEAVRFNNFLQALREGEDRSINSNEAAEFALHAMVRAKNIRSMLEAGVEKIMEYARPHLFEDAIREKVALSEFRRNPDLILEKIGAKDQSTSQRQQTIRRLNRELPKLVRHFVRTQRLAMDQLMENFLRKTGEVIADGHRRMLLERLHDFSGGRAKEFRSMEWRRVTFSGPLLLGDSVLFVELVDGSFKPAHEPGDSVERVVLPISSTQALVGSPISMIASVTAHRICEGAAACSFDAFCAAEAPPQHDALVRLIRTQTFSLDEISAKRLAADAIGEFTA